MKNTTKTGVYFCKYLNGHPDSLNLDELSVFTKDLPEVSKVWESSGLDVESPEILASQIKENQITRIVIAGNRPGYVQPAFTKAMVLAGQDPSSVFIASFQEYDATTRKDTDIAKAIIACAVLGVPFELAALPTESKVHPDTLVIGGGIAGIQASLEIANSGNKVYLLERTGTIGGHMAMFDKTFPTLDCAACILTPKMVEVGQHPNIQLMTYCEVKSVSGEPGNFKVKILKKARRVNLATCIGCNMCSEKCPGKAPK